LIRVELKKMLNNERLKLLDLVKNSEYGTISSENENSNLSPANQLYTSGYQRDLLGS
jgi:hypothetical protein